jgi:hypothetical protein
MFRRYASLLVVSLGLALSAPVFACVQLEQDNNCCPDKPPCGECPTPDAAHGGLAAMCVTSPAAAANVSAPDSRAQLNVDRTGDLPVANCPELRAPPRAPALRERPPPLAEPPPPSAEPTWLITRRLRI